MEGCADLATSLVTNDVRGAPSEHARMCGECDVAMLLIIDVLKAHIKCTEKR